MVPEGWHYLPPFLQVGEDEAQPGEATSPSKWVTKPEFKAQAVD